MGIEWTLKCSKSWKRHWQKNCAEFSSPSLFPMTLTDVQKTIRGSLYEGEQLKKDDSVVIQFYEGQLMIRRGNKFIGTSDELPELFLQAACSEGLPCLSGIVCEVFALSGDVEIIVTE
jgi:hypothetical protein